MLVKFDTFCPNLELLVSLCSTNPLSSIYLFTLSKKTKRTSYASVIPKLKKIVSCVYQHQTTAHSIQNTQNRLLTKMTTINTIYNMINEFSYGFLSDDGTGITAHQ